MVKNLKCDKIKCMDKKKILLLKYLTAMTGNGYKVLETSAILNSLNRYKKDYAELKKDIEFLRARKYIDVKYIDENNICLMVLDNSRVLQENLKIEHGNKKSLFIMMILTSVISGIMAFLGSFLAIIILR